MHCSFQSDREPVLRLPSYRGVGENTIRIDARAVLPLVGTTRTAEILMRLKSAIWVSAYLRRRHLDGTLAVVRRRGAEEAGAVFVKINRLDGTAELYGPAPQSAFEESRPSDRAFTPCFKVQPVPEAEVEAYLAREIRFDSDVWIVEVEDRSGSHLLDVVA
jgi:hypothetical protein